MRTLFINGKFAAQRMTGVQRLAASLLQALDQLLQESGNTDVFCIKQRFIYFESGSKA